MYRIQLEQLWKAYEIPLGQDQRGHVQGRSYTRHTKPQTKLTSQTKQYLIDLSNFR